MSLLSFLSVPISDFLPFFKAAKWNIIIWGGFIIWVPILEYIPYTSSVSWTQALQVIQLCLKFVSACYGWNAIMNDTKWPDRLWVDVSGSLVLILFPSSSWRPEYFEVKMAWSNTPMVWPRMLDILFSIFSPIFHQSCHVKKWSHMDPTFVEQSLPPLEMICTFEL